MALDDMYETSRYCVLAPSDGQFQYSCMLSLAMCGVDSTKLWALNMTSVNGHDEHPYKSTDKPEQRGTHLDIIAMRFVWVFAGFPQKSVPYTRLSLGGPHLRHGFLGPFQSTLQLRASIPSVTKFISSPLTW